MAKNKSGDNLPAHVTATVDISLGEKGSKMLDMLEDIQATISEVAVQRQKLNELGYDITFNTEDGELVVELTDVSSE